MTCEPIKQKKDRVCIGDLSTKIEVETRDITAPTGGVDFDESFGTFKTLWAMVQTAGTGETIFDESNIEQSITHHFYVRYVPNFNFQKWIKYKDQYYNILDVENLNEEDRFLKIRATVRGNTALDVNKV
jgi:head-tail adaptor